ncbi:efflux RND transporter permease subunit [Anoxynatronum buryatiense]|uniref:Multidrug efflux pump subunit AcrB n=1 Tax=Anoxynatronum buryatiense TaxID=489973 RepID=A0AA45WV38_9CLOT|nr:efflux RND transporter permease subunit [Anoxynatronum buryatiense]SMP51034.1 Multidrug efflux pump subunit AcrB [Anoxynatronum buryatiense]
MQRLIETAVKQRRIVLFLAAATALFGLFSYQMLPKQENPMIKINAAMVTTHYPGATPEEVESLITREIEDVLSEMDDLKQLFSDSAAGLSVVFAIYEDDADIDKANQQVREKLENVRGRLPEGSMEPAVATNLGESAGFMISLSGSSYNNEQLTAFGETMEAALRGINGLYKTTMLGTVEKQVTVEIKQAELNQVGLSLRELNELLWVQQLEMPAGSLPYDAGPLTVTTETAYGTVADVAGQVVAVSREMGSLMKLKDLARVEMAYEEDAARILQGEAPAVLLAGYFREDQNMIPVGKEVRQQLAAVAEQLPPDLVITEVTFQPQDVERSMTHFIGSLLMGMGLVMVMILMGMGLRNALVVSAGIPLAVLGTFSLMGITAITFQSVSLAGLMIALGMIVDNNIVISDAIQNRFDQGADRETAAIEAVGEIAIPVFTSTLTTMAAFLPLMFISGEVGQFMESLPRVVMFALMASFLTAILVTPAFMTMMMTPRKQRFSDEVLAKGSRFFVRLLQKSARRKGWVLLAVGGFFLLTMAGVVPRLPLAFFPKADKEVLYVETYVERAGDIEKTEVIARQINALLEAEPEVVQVTTGVGTPLLKFYTTMMPVAPQPELTRAIVTFDLDRSQRFTTKDQLAMHLQDQLDARVAGARATVRLLELSDPASPVTIRLRGENLNQLKHVAMEVEQALKKLPGTMNVASNASDSVYQYQVTVAGDQAALAGLMHADVQQEVSLALFGSRRAVLRQEGKAYDIQVKSDIATVADLEQMGIKSSITGEKVPLAQVAEVKLVPQIERISRFNQERSLVVTSDIRPGYSAVAVSNALEEQMKNGWDPRGVTVSFEGEREDIDNNFSHMGILGFFTLCLIYAILLVEFKSFRDPLLILFTVPLSMTGSVLGLWLLKQPLSLTALLGVISLMGIVVNNAILLMDHIKGSRCQGKKAEEACYDAVHVRFRPIVLSTITTIMGLMPLALSSSELFRPMAIALISGLLVATLLTLVVIPLLYQWMEERFNGWKSGLPE